MTFLMFKKGTFDLLNNIKHLIVKRFTYSKFLVGGKKVPKPVIPIMIFFITYWFSKH